MSHQDYIEESLWLFDESEKCENDSVKTTIPSDSEEDASPDEKKAHPSDSPCRSDDTVSTSSEVHQNNQSVVDQLSDPRVEEADTKDDFILEFPESTCGHSDSEASSGDDSSDFYSFFAEPTGFQWYITEYTYQLTRLRNIGCLLPFEIIGLAVTIACCFMGAKNWPSCPADLYIPRYVFFNGAVGTFSVCVLIMDSIWKFVMPRVDFNLQRYGRYFCAFGLFWVAIITTVVEMIEFYTMSYSFHRNDENYCDETFYWFVFYKNIAFGILMFLTALIYIPTFHFNYWMHYIA